MQGRATQGKRIVATGAGDRVVEVSRVAREGGGPPRTRAAARPADAAVTDADGDEPLTDEEQLELMR